MAQRLLWWLVAIWVLLIAVSNPVNAEVTTNSTHPMVIEWLKFKVPETQRDRYLEIDNEIWTSALATYPGFLDKTTWLDPHHADEVIFVIAWATREQWKAIPENDLDNINQRFDEALGFDYEMIESKEFVVPASASVDD